ncbi:hypothetical protein MF408_11515 [Nocardioides sp. TF02-7]|nr:hypothetical protein [Nocardioides sp. TF02-7]UMG94790.1 hypothetical protein MF408_11515 [Nocardioides sp. TF02-7]
MDDCDVVLAMDGQNLRDIAELGPAETGRLLMFRAFDPEEPDADVPDPYYGGDEGFHEVLAMVERTCDGIVDALRRLRLG